MMPPAVRSYLIAALSGTPDVAERLLNDLDTDDPRWDFRPDASRFTLREVVAHLADWEPINLERITRMQEDDNPMLADIDEGKMAADNDYANSDPHGSLAWMRSGRQKFVARLGTLRDEEWTRAGHRERLGPMTIEIFAALVTAHDGYHMQQIAQYLTLAGAARPSA